MVAAVFGAIYTLVGIAGFFVADNFVGEEGSLLLGFQSTTCTASCTS